MKTWIVCGLFLLFVSAACARGEVATEDAKLNAADLIAPILSEAVKSIVTSPEGQKYFKDLDVNAIQLDTKPVLQGSKGWVVRWHYSRDIVQVMNPNKSSSVGTVPRAETKDGVEINLMVAAEGGGAFIQSKRFFPIYSASNNKPLAVSYDLVTFSEDKELQALIEKTCLELREKVMVVLGLSPMTKR